MRLGDIKNRTYFLVGFDPQVATHTLEVEDVLGMVYSDFFTSREWSFAEKTVNLYTLPDITETATTVIQASGTPYLSLTLTLGGSLRLKTEYEGAILTISGATADSDNVDYVIDKVDGATCHIRRLEGNNTSNFSNAETVTITVRARYLPLPADCSQLIGVDRIDGSTSEPLTPMTREAWRHLDLSSGGQPNNWSITDLAPLFRNTLELPPLDFDVTGTDIGPDTGWPEGTYRFYMAYTYGNVQGPMGEYVELEIAANECPTFTTLDTTAGGVFGVRKNIFVQLYEDVGGSYGDDLVRDLSSWDSGVNQDTAGRNEFIIDDDTTSLLWDGSVAGDALPVSLAFLKTLPRAQVNDSRYQVIDLYPHPSSQQQLRLRYLRLPTKLVEDVDVPACPPDTHEYLVYRTCELLLIKHGDNNAAMMWKLRADDALQRIESRYLVQRGHVPTKGNAFVSQGWGRVRSSANITHNG